MPEPKLLRIACGSMVIFLLNGLLAGCQSRVPTNSSGTLATLSGKRLRIKTMGIEMLTQKDNTVLTFESTQIVFPHQKLGPERSIHLRFNFMPDDTAVKQQTGNEDFVLSYESKNYDTTFTLGNHTLTLLQGGTALRVGSREFPLDPERLQTIIIEADSTITVHDPYSVPQNASAPELYTLLLEGWSKGKQAEVEQFLVSACQRYPNDAPLAFFRAACTRSRFDIKSARPLFKTIVTIAPQTPEGKCAALNLALDSKENPDANFEQFRTLVSQHPQKPLLLWMLAVQCRTYKHNTEGIKCYQKLLKQVSVGSSLVHQTYANLLDEVGEYEKALPSRYRAYQLEPTEWSRDGFMNTMRQLGFSNYVSTAEFRRQAGLEKPIVLPPMLFLSAKKRQTYFREYMGLMQKSKDGTEEIDHDSLPVRNLLKRYRLSDDQLLLIYEEGMIKKWKE
jgi:hypothetical protein